MMNNKHVVICGFSGRGKSTAEKQSYPNNVQVNDIESSQYHYLEDGSENPDFITDYIDELQRRMKIYDNAYNNMTLYYLLSCHENVRKELKRRQIPFIIVMPKADYNIHMFDCRNEYMKRWTLRGDSSEFMTKMYKNWREMIQSCLSNTSPKIYLNSDEYLTDILPRIKDITSPGGLGNIQLCNTEHTQ